MQAGSSGLGMRCWGAACSAIGAQQAIRGSAAAPAALLMPMQLIAGSSAAHHPPLGTQPLFRAPAARQHQHGAMPAWTAWPARCPRAFSTTPLRSAAAATALASVAACATACAAAASGTVASAFHAGLTTYRRSPPGAFSRRLHWFRYSPSINRWVSHSLSPSYWSNLQWPTIEMVMHSASQWLPSIPGAARFHIPVLSALNLVGAHLPRLLAVTMVETLRTTREARALSFETFAGSAEAEALASAQQAHQHWLVARAQSGLEVIWHVTRLLWLMLVFMPVGCKLATVCQWGERNCR
jgi:hypothetical protein